LGSPEKGEGGVTSVSVTLGQQTLPLSIFMHHTSLATRFTHAADQPGFNDPAKRARGVPSGMSKICPECFAPDLPAAHVFLRKEPDEDDEEEEDDGEKDGDEDEDNSNDDGDDDGYSP
jgi:hypothetical protein